MINIISNVGRDNEDHALWTSQCEILQAGS